MMLQKVGLFMGNAQGQDTAGNVTLAGMKKARKQDGRSVFAGDMNKPDSDIDAKKQELHKKAMKVLTDAAGNEAKIDEDIEGRRSKIKELQESSQAANEEINKLDEEIQKSKEAHGVADGSQEQKDLELLLKKKSNRELSEDEMKRLDEMGDMTAYQREALQYESLKGDYRKQIDKNQKEIGMESSVIRSTKVERLKSHAMVDAENSKDKMMEEAAKEITGMLSGDAMEHIQEELDKEMEEAQKKAEEKEEAEKKLEESKLEREEEQLQLEKDRNESTPNQPVQVPGPAQPENVQQIQQADITHEQLEAELKKVMQEEKLLEEELKGLAVDAKS